MGKTKLPPADVTVRVRRVAHGRVLVQASVYDEESERLQGLVTDRVVPTDCLDQPELLPKIVAALLSVLTSWQPELF